MGRILRAQLVVGLTDRARGPAGQLINTLKQLRAVGQMNIGHRMDRSMRSMKRSADNLSSSSTGIGLFGGLLIRNSYLFDRLMSQIAMTSDAPAEKITELRNKIVELAKANPKVRREIARGALEFITAGNSIDRTIASLKDLTKGAVAGMQEVGKTGEDVTDVVAAMYGNIPDPKQYAARVRESLNIMAVGASSANHKWQEQTLAMSYSVPVARALGISLEQLTAMLGVLADNGFKGEKGGSALRTILLNLRAPTAKARRAFSELGVELEKAFKFNEKKAFNPSVLLGQLKHRFGSQGEGVAAVIRESLSDKMLRGDLNSMRDVLLTRLSKAMNIKPGDLLKRTELARAIDAHFRAATENFNPEYLFMKMKNANAAQIKAITGIRRTPQMMALVNGFEDQYKPKLDKINEKKEGATMRRVGKYMNSFAGTIDQFTSKLDGFADTLERVAIVPIVKEITQALSDMTDWLEKSDPAWIKFAVYALMAVAILGPLGLMLNGLVSSISLIASGISFAGLAVGSFGRLLGGPLAKGLLLGMRRFTFMKRGVLGLGLALTRGVLAPLAILAAISWPVLLGAAAIAGVIIYWEKLKAFFTGFFTELDNAFAKAGLGRPLKALADIASDLLGSVADLFKISSDKNGLAEWAEAGKSAARALANAVRSVIDNLKSAYAWVKKWINGFSNQGATAPTKSRSRGTNIEARATGGPIRAGRPYLVGERGAELIVPQRNGFVLPNSALAGRRSGAQAMSVGAVTVNVTPPQGVQDPTAWGKKLGAAVREQILDTHSDGGYA